MVPVGLTPSTTSASLDLSELSPPTPTALVSQGLQCLSGKACPRTKEDLSLASSTISVG